MPVKPDLAVSVTPFSTI